MVKQSGRDPIANELPMYTPLTKLLRHLLDCQPKDAEKLSSTIHGTMLTEPIETQTDSYSFAQSHWRVLSVRAERGTLSQMPLPNYLFLEPFVERKYYRGSDAKSCPNERSIRKNRCWFESGRDVLV